MEHAVILVVYERFLGDCEAGKTLPGALPPGSRVCVYDNSGSDHGNAAFCAQHGWAYFTDHRNNGLSKAYQFCADHLLQTGFSGWVSLFDDDTSIDADYFPALDAAVQGDPQTALFFPMLYAEEKLISPQIIPSNQHARYFASEQACLQYTSQDLFAFNSGMAVRSDVYDHVQYHKDLFLDGVDYAFLRDCYQAGYRSRAFAVKMQHGFSGAQASDCPTALNRFENYARDHALVLRDNPSGYRYLVGKRALHLMLMYHKLSFLAIFRKYHP